MDNSVKQAVVAAADAFAKAKGTDAVDIKRKLLEVFEKDLNFLTKVAEFDSVFDDYPVFDELREVFFDLLMINFFTSDVGKLEDDYLDSPEWASIEEKTLDRGTELLNLLLYINE